MNNKKVVNGNYNYSEEEPTPTPSLPLKLHLSPEQKTKDSERQEPRKAALELVASKPSSFFENAASSTHTEIMDIPAAAKFLSVTEKALRLRVTRREIPFFKIGRRVFFTQRLIEEWIEQHLVQTRFGPVLHHKRR